MANICSANNSWTINLNYATNTTEVSLLQDWYSTGIETYTTEVQNLLAYGPYWLLNGTAAVGVYNYGGNSFLFNLVTI